MPNSSKILSFIWEHRTELALGVGWFFSLAMSVKPPVPPNAGYWAVWLNNIAQAIAANPHKMQLPPKE